MICTVPSSPLSALLARVGAVMSAAGDATPIMIGKSYLERGIGAGPRVVFVPETRGLWGPPPKLFPGTIAGVTTGCMMLVRGAESGDDATRFEAAEALADLMINVIRHLAPGRITGGEWKDDSPLPVDAYGADLALSFAYTRAVSDSPTVRAAIAAALCPVEPADPMRPRGDLGTTYTTVPTTNGSR